ncbi:hypothetical protein VTK56DRAFT_6453 [Thermocarpiscus australiensis]
MGGLSAEDEDSIVAIERACSAVSLLGCLFVLVTFSVSDAFRKRAINRLVFYATFGNMLTNVATLMTRSYMHNLDSFGCQLQGFLIQVFMQGDAYWALAMAINVYLTFYHKYDARMLRRMEIPYFICCYGIPFIPGFIFLFVSSPHAGRPYGNAVLWCWLSFQWEVYRIATFYGPVWVAILAAMSIYIRAGREIYRKRLKMLKFSSTGTGTAVGSAPLSLNNDVSPAFNFRTTEVVQTSEFIHPPAPVAAPGTISSSPASFEDQNVSYSVTISANANHRASLDDCDGADAATTATLTSTASNGDHHPVKPNPAKDKATPTTQLSTRTTNNPQQQARRRPHYHHHCYESHSAAWSYTKCAILFFCALLVTWIPSSGNRVYSLVHGGAVSRPLFYASAFVLPLQGFWNAIIYVVTSWAACKSLWASCAVHFFGSGPGSGSGWWRWRCRGRLRGWAGRGSSLGGIADARLRGVGGDGGGGGGGNHGMTGKGKAAGIGMWSGRQGDREGESTSMEDLTGEGRTERVSPV